MFGTYKLWHHASVLIFISLLILSFLLAYKITDYIADFKTLKQQSRIEIVRKAPPRPKNENESGKQDNSDQKPYKKDGGEKKLVERRIIPQEIYEGKGGQGKRRGDNRKKDKDYNSKKEDQEMISLEKAAAQKHKKRSHKEEEQEAITSIVVNQPMTIQELADKIRKSL